MIATAGHIHDHSKSYDKLQLDIFKVTASGMIGEIVALNF